MKKIFLSIIVPTYQEERRIENCLRKINHFLSKQKYSSEVIFVDDGSSDSTISKIKNQKSKMRNYRFISYKPNRGKGYAVKKGVMAAKGEYILFCDADLSTPIEEINKLLPFTEKYSMVIGSRYLEKNSIKIKQPIIRQIISRLGRFLIKIVLGLNFADTQCGFKLFQNKVAKEIFKRITIKRWGFDIELLIIAKILGLRVKEVAIDWYNDPRSQVRAGRAAINTFRELMKIKRNLDKGIYKNENI